MPDTAISIEILSRTTDPVLLAREAYSPSREVRLIIAKNNNTAGRTLHRLVVENINDLDFIRAAVTHKRVTSDTLNHIRNHGSLQAIEILNNHLLVSRNRVAVRKNPS